MARSKVNQSVLTGYPAADMILHGATCLPEPRPRNCGGEVLHNVSVFMASESASPPIEQLDFTEPMLPHE
jgi:hypothetical protein